MQTESIESLEICHQMSPVCRVRTVLQTWSDVSEVESYSSREEEKSEDKQNVNQAGYSQGGDESMAGKGTGELRPATFTRLQG